MLKLKLQCFRHLRRRADSLEKTLMLGKIEDKKEKRATEDEMVEWHHRFNGHELGGKLQEMVRDRKACGAAVHEVAKNWA